MVKLRINRSMELAWKIKTWGQYEYSNVARYCSTKHLYYYGVKLHVLGWKCEGGLPWPESIIVTNAAENDLTVFKENWNELADHNFYGDKIYHNKEWFEVLDSR